MRKLITFIGLFLCLLTGVFSAPTYHSVEAATSSLSNAQTLNLADEINPSDLEIGRAHV